MGIRSAIHELTRPSYSAPPETTRRENAPEQPQLPKPSLFPKMQFRHLHRPAWASRDRVDPAEIRQINDADMQKKRHDRFMGFYTSMAYGMNSHYQNCAQKFTPDFIENCQDKIRSADNRNEIPFGLRRLYEDHTEFLRTENCGKSTDIDTDRMHFKFCQFLNAKEKNIESVKGRTAYLNDAVRNIETAGLDVNPQNLAMTMRESKVQFETAMRLPPSTRSLKQAAMQDALGKMAYCVSMSYLQSTKRSNGDGGALAGAGARSLRQMTETYHQATRMGAVSAVHRATVENLIAMEVMQSQFASSGWFGHHIDKSEKIGPVLDAMLRRA